MMALVAMLLVATGGSARATQHRVSASTGQAAAAPQPGRQADVQAPVQQDQPAHVLDLVATSSSRDVERPVTSWTTVTAEATPFTGTRGVTPTGRAPPAP